MSTPCPVLWDPGSAGTSPGVYQRRRPERTVPCQAVQEHLETWLARQREADTEGDPIPAYVERDLRRLLPLPPGPIVATGIQKTGMFTDVPVRALRLARRFRGDKR